MYKLVELIMLWVEIENNLKKKKLVKMSKRDNRLATRCML